MGGYAKLWSGITESSLWDGSKEARLLFVSMLARADQVGFVEAAPSGLARIANLTKEEVASALEELTSPDPESKSKIADGKRVAVVPRGFCVVNYEEYRARRDDDERREYMREYMRKYRAGKKEVNQGVNSSKSSKPGLAQAEAEAEAEAEKNTTPSGKPSPSAPVDVLQPVKRKGRVRLSLIRRPEDQTAFETLWSEWPREREGKPARGEKPKAEACFQEILNGGEVSASELVAAGRLYIAEDERVKAGFPKMVSSFLALKDGFWRSAVKLHRHRVTPQEVAV